MHLITKTTRTKLIMPDDIPFFCIGYHRCQSCKYVFPTYLQDNELAESTFDFCPGCGLRIVGMYAN